MQKKKKRKSDLIAKEPKKISHLSLIAVKKYADEEIIKLRQNIYEKTGIQDFPISYKLEEHPNPYDNAFIAQGIKIASEKYKVLNLKANRLLKETVTISFDNNEWRMLQSQGYYTLLTAVRTFMVKRNGIDPCDGPTGHQNSVQQVGGVLGGKNFFEQAKSFRIWSDYCIINYIKNSDYKVFLQNFIQHVSQMYGLNNNDNLGKKFLEESGVL